MRTSCVALIGLLSMATACQRGTDRAEEDAGEAALEERIAAGESLYFAGAYDSARVVFTALMPDAQRSRDSSLEPRLLTWLGLAAWRLGDFPNARELGERALAMKQERGIEAEIARSYNALGLLAWHEGRLTDAARLFVHSRDQAQASADRLGVGRAVGNMGLIQMELADFAGARESFATAVGVARDLGDIRLEANALANLATLQLRAGETNDAVSLLAEARRLYGSIGYPNGEQNALGQLATAYGSRGQLSEALAAIDSAMALVREHGLVQEEAAYLEMLGNLHFQIGDAPRALHHLARARALADSLGLALQAANILRTEAAVHGMLGNTVHARGLVARALAAHRHEALPFEELDDRLLLAELLTIDGQPDSAEAQLREGESIAATLSSLPATVSVQLTRARIADRSRRPRDVLRALEGADTTWMALDATSWWEPHALRARAHAALGNAEAAIAEGRRAVADVEVVRRNLGGAPLRTSFLSHRSGAYADLVLNLLHAGRVAEAFETADAARGRALLEHLSTARRQLVQGSPPDEQLALLLQQMDALMSRIAEMERAPDPQRGESAVAHGELTRRLRELRSQYESALQLRRPSGADADGGTAPVSLGMAQRALAANELLVQYVVAEDRLVIIATTSDSVHWFEGDATRDELRGAVRLAREMLSHPEVSGYAQVLHELRALLLGPLEAAGLLDDLQALVVIPHDALTYLPFAAMREPGSGRGAPSYAMLTQPSSAAFVRLRDRSRSHAAPAARRLAVFAPFPRQLPASRGEVRTVQREMRGADSRIGARATEAHVRDALAGSEVVHIASHALMNPHNAMFSRVELARGRPGTSSDDGRLEVHELLNISINSRLVFLSACETALGSGWSTDYAPGEDFATLAHAFLLAGADNVIATLWRIDDAGAAEFAGRFYRHLGKTDPATALALTQREMQQDPRYRHPYYWAGYTIAGAGSTETRRSLAAIEPAARAAGARP